MDERTWEELLSTALAILDDACAQGVGAPDIVMGGGTVLMMRMHHRLSRDIDLFLHDAQWLGRLTPRLNDRVAARARDYSEQANSVKLVMPRAISISSSPEASRARRPPRRSSSAAGRSCSTRRRRSLQRNSSFAPHSSSRATPSIWSRPRLLFQTPLRKRSRPPRRAETRRQIGYARSAAWRRIGYRRTSLQWASLPRSCRR